MKKIFIGADHGGFELKSQLIPFIEDQGYEVLDLGPFNTESVDYPDYASKVARKVSREINSIGVLICKSGIGVSISANKIKGIRAALVNNVLLAVLSRLHNNANVICFGSSFITVSEAQKSVLKFIKTDFEGGRHSKRVDKIKELEE